MISQAGEGDRGHVQPSDEDVTALCTRIAVIHEGRTRFTGTPTELTVQAAGRVWTDAQRSPAAIAAWRTVTALSHTLATRGRRGADPTHAGGRVPPAHGRTRAGGSPTHDHWWTPPPTLDAADRKEAGRLAGIPLLCWPPSSWS